MITSFVQPVLARIFSPSNYISDSQYYSIHNNTCFKKTLAIELIPSICEPFQHCRLFQPSTVAQIGPLILLLRYPVSRNNSYLKLEAHTWVSNFQSQKCMLTAKWACKLSIVKACKHYLFEFCETRMFYVGCIRISLLCLS